MPAMFFPSLPYVVADIKPYIVVGNLFVFVMYVVHCGFDSVSK